MPADRARHAGNGAGLAILGYGFRPFFLVAGIQAALVVPLFLLVYLGDGTFASSWPVALWHAHEMLFGYALAVVAGFLLTAVPGWQKTTPVAGGRLALLVGLWLAGRLAMAGDGVLPPLLVAGVDIAFVPVLGLVGVPSLLHPRARRNRVFLALLVLLTIANGLMHAAAQGLIDGRVGYELALDTLALLIAIVGGRVIPAFTTNGLAAGGRRGVVRPHDRRDPVAVATVAALLIADAAANLDPRAVPLVAVVALLAALTNGWRMVGWGTRHTLGKPILWVLHLGYGWLVVSFAAKGLAAADAIDPRIAFHALGIGAIGTMTLAIMTRAALGHTGRVIEAAPAIVAVYLLVSLAAVARIVAVVEGGAWGLIVAGAAWTLAYALFVIAYTPVLARPRPDGRPG